MTYDTTQAQPVMLDGTELKIGDEVIIARQPANPETDSLWNDMMVPCFTRPAGVVSMSYSGRDREDYGSPLVRARVLLESGETQTWWFRLSELSRPHTYYQSAQPTDTPTEFPNLVHTNETTGPGVLHPAVLGNPYSPYSVDWLINEHRLCPYDETHGTLSLRPGFDAYLTQVEFEKAQKHRRERFYVWRDERETKRIQFLRQIRKQLTTHPFDGTKKGGVNWRNISAFDRSYYTCHFHAQHRDGRAAAKIIGKLVGHFHPTNPRPLPEDEVFALLRTVQSFQARDALGDRTDQTGAAFRAYIAARRKIYSTGEWGQVPWHSSNWFCDNPTALNRLPHISTVNPQEVAYYQSVDKLIRGIETRTKPGRFIQKFFPHLSSDQIRQYANDYLVATAPKQLHFARTRDEIITAIDEGPSESCQTRGYYDKAPDERPWYRGHIHPAACYASGDFEVAYITDNNQPADITQLHAGTQRITARAICNAKNKTVARIYGDAAKMEPLLTSAGYTKVERALVGCRLLKIENEEGSGWIIPYVDAGIGSGGGALWVDDHYDHESDNEYWLLTTSGDYHTYEGYDNKGVLCGEDNRHTCPRCGAAHDDEDDIHYSDYEETHYCESCDDDFVYAVVRVGRYGTERDMVRIDNALDIDGDWYVDDADLLARCGLVQCVHCDEWASLDNTTTTDRGQVCDDCSNQVVPLAEESSDGNEYGYRPDCTQYVNTETGDVVWLDDNSDVDDFTTDDDTPKYVSLDAWREMQQRQESFEFVGPPKHSPEPYTLVVSLTQLTLDDLRI